MFSPKTKQTKLPESESIFWGISDMQRREAAGTLRERKPNTIRDIHLP